MLETLKYPIDIPRLSKNVDGMVPTNEFEFTSNVCNFISPYSLGIVPLNKFDGKRKACKDVTFASSVGKFPASPLRPVSAAKRLRKRSIRSIDARRAH